MNNLSFKLMKPEEIYILYENNILVCIDGANLYHYLRAARKYAATSSDTKIQFKNSKFEILF